MNKYALTKYFFIYLYKKLKLKAMNEVFNIEFQDREIKVIASWDLGEEGTYDTPPMNGAYYTDYVYYKDRDITGILSLESFNQIFEIINE